MAQRALHTVGMNLNPRMLLLLVPLFLAPAMSHATPAVSPQDEKALRALMTDLDLRWKQRDMAAYLAHYAEDADVVNRGGGWFRGRAEFKQQLDWLAKNGRPEIFTMRTDIEAIRAIAPGVFVLVQHRDENVRKSRATFVIARSGDTLRIQSVSIAPIEPPSGPQAQPQPATR